MQNTTDAKKKTRENLENLLVLQAKDLKNSTIGGKTRNPKESRNITQPNKRIFLPLSTFVNSSAFLSLISPFGSGPDLVNHANTHSLAGGSNACGLRMLSRDTALCVLLSLSLAAHRSWCSGLLSAPHQLRSGFVSTLISCSSA